MTSQYARNWEGERNACEQACLICYVAFSHSDYYMTNLSVRVGYGVHMHELLCEQGAVQGGGSTAGLRLSDCVFDMNRAVSASFACQLMSLLSLSGSTHLSDNISAAFLSSVWTLLF